MSRTRLAILVLLVVAAGWLLWPAVSKSILGAAASLYGAADQGWSSAYSGNAYGQSGAGGGAYGPGGSVGATPLNETKPPSTCLTLKSDLYLTQTDAQTGGDVTKLQQYLVRAGYLAAAPTGYFGLATRQALMTYQQHNGLAEAGGVGYAGPKTRALLACAPSPASAVPPSLTLSPAAGVAPLTVTVAASNLARGKSYRLDFGDGSRGMLKPLCVYSNDRTYGNGLSCSASLYHVYQGGTYTVGLYDMTGALLASATISANPGF
jgi:peptidoglycan hydrolase-like protein with peptidoglycan-binding domain